MDSNSALHNVAKAAKPDEKLPIKPTRFWAAVLWNDLRPDGDITENSFLWVKCTGKITVQTIQNEYWKRRPMDLVLKLGDTDIIPSKDAPLSQLNTFNDNLVVFRALEASSVEARRTAPPQTLTPNPPSMAYDPIPHLTPVSPAPLPSIETTDHLAQSATAPAPHYVKSESESGSDASDNASDSTANDDDPMSEADDDGSDAASQVSGTDIKHEEAGPAEAIAGDGLFIETQYSQEDDAPRYLPELLKSSVPEELERGVTKAVKLLDALQTTLQGQAETSPDAQQWIAAIGNLRTQAVRTRTVVGVVGNTGAGKSSVINAMLDEERLVPTNCMRACTAVVTEMSWNDNTEERRKYRAEIEFIQPQDWEKELQVLFTDLLDPNGEVSRESSNPDSEAGVAYAKIKAVYPQMTKDDIARSSVEQLMRQPIIRRVLGTTININKARPEDFYRDLQTWVDSKEKATGQDKDKKTPRKVEYWPLIKVVKIYVKSPALETGAVVVDLPGVHDSNAARAAVAEGYMKQCTGLWIVAPITRAVDDKAAKTLLGDTFKRQLKYDGTYSAVTFICSKTDDISITEAVDTLDLEEEIKQYYDDDEAAQKKLKELESTIKDMKEEQAVRSELFDEQDDLLDKWEALSKKHGDGKIVYPPREKKRKANKKQQKSRKKRASSDSGSEFGFESESDNDISETESEDDEGVQPLTEEQIETKLREIRDLKKQARRERVNIGDRIKETRKEMAAVKEANKSTKAKMNAICIAGRNSYSRGAIQVDFAAGVKELDQENAIEQDEHNFDPNEDIRDYDKVAKDLPVFCVSSRAYQKLCGRLKKDSAVPGFTTLEETEIPQLQAHCKKLTEAGRASSCRRFLHSLAQLLTSMTLWSSNDGTGLNLTDKQKASEVRFLEKRLDDLEKGLERAVASCVQNIKEVLAGNIYDKHDHATAEAAKSAIPTATSWGAHRSEGGLFWATYKATVRRSGVFSGASGPKDFNAELCEPITKYLASGWEKAFQRRLPSALQEYKKASNSLLHRFHAAVENHARESGAGIAGLTMLLEQVTNHEQLFSELTAVVMNSITERQREANREFSPVIAAAMEYAYTACSEESGKGSYARMKSAMLDHVTRERSSMFEKAVDGVKDKLTKMCREVEVHCADQAERVWQTMRQDYMQVLGGAASHNGQQLPKQERTLRRDVQQAIEGSNEAFGAVVRGEPDDEVEGLQAVKELKAEVDDENDDDFVDAKETVEMADADEEQPGFSAPSSQLAIRQGSIASLHNQNNVEANGTDRVKIEPTIEANGFQPINGRKRGVSADSNISSASPNHKKSKFSDNFNVSADDLMNDDTLVATPEPASIANGADIFSKPNNAVFLANEDDKENMNVSL